VKHLVATATLAVAFVLLALASGAHRRGAVIGAVLSGGSAVASVAALARFGRGPVRRALAVFVAGFLVRIALVAAGVVVVKRTGASVVGFVVAFFVPYFSLAVVEALFIHSLDRDPIA
jgi:hypothetical protein